MSALKALRLRGVQTRVTVIGMSKWVVIGPHE
jgi:hypothetical protein